jgi:hypothetical protein
MDTTLLKFVTTGIRVWIVTITFYVTFREPNGVSLVLITSELSTRKKEEEKQSKRKSSNEHKCLSL